MKREKKRKIIAENHSYSFALSFKQKINLMSSLDVDENSKQKVSRIKVLFLGNKMVASWKVLIIFFLVFY